MKDDTYNGNVEITESNQSEWTKKLKRIKKRTGYLSVHSNVTLQAEALTSIGGDLYVHSNVINRVRKASF